MYEDFKNWYVNYCEAEGFYDNHSEDFDNAYENGGELGLLYSFYEDDEGMEHNIEVCISLNPAEEIVYIDGKVKCRNRFENIDELYGAYKGVDWEDIYNWVINNYID